MKYAMDVKVNLKPVFSNMVHSDIWEGPCRVGLKEELDPRYEIRVGKEQFKVWEKELRDHIGNYANIMEPVYLEFDETFVVSEQEFAKLDQDAHEVDLYLITYRVQPALKIFAGEKGHGKYQAVDSLSHGGSACQREHQLLRSAGVMAEIRNP